MHTIDELKDILRDPEDGQVLYQALEHEAFADWASKQPCEERWRMIQQVELPHNGTCIDLGCHTGWFCRAFSRQGWDALGIDTNPVAIEVATEHMREYDGNPPPKYQLGDFKEMGLVSADVVLCLSLIMYLFPTAEQGWKTMDDISRLAPLMFLDCGGMYSDRLPFAVGGAGEEIVKHTTYTGWDQLGVTAMESRPFFLLSRAP